MAFGINRRISLRVLDRNSIDAVHWASMHVLERVGVRVYSAACRKILTESGCEVEERSGIARIPSHLVTEALSKTSKTITLAARNRKYDARLDMDHSYMCPSGNGAIAFDFETGERRPSTKEDVRRSSKVCDAMGNIHVHWPMVTSTDKPPSSCHLHDLEASLNNTEKHIMYETGVTVPDARNLIAMGYAASGGEKEYRARPITSALQCTFAPLQHDAGVMDAGLEFAKAGVPLVYFCMPQLGATGPATLAGSLVVGNAEVLSALVMTQLAVPGAAVIYGLGIAPLDMRTTIRAGGSPEHALCSAMATELAHSYGLPSCVGVSSTANAPGDQACVETFTGVSVPLMAGADLLCGIGQLEDGSCLLLEEIPIEDEIVGVVARLCRGEVVNEETLALDVIEKVGVGKDYLAQRHTLQHIRTEHFTPTLMERQSYDAWIGGGRKSMLDKARQKVRQILTSYEVPPLEPDTQKHVTHIIEECERSASGKT